VAHLLHLVEEIGGGSRGASARIEHRAEANAMNLDFFARRRISGWRGGIGGANLVTDGQNLAGDRGVEVCVRTYTDGIFAPRRIRIVVTDVVIRVVRAGAAQRGARGRVRRAVGFENDE